MRGRAEPTVSEGLFGHRGRWCVLVLGAALVLGLVAAVPVFAAGEENVEPQVVGGKPVPDGKYPFMASLEARFPEEPGGEPSTPFLQFCGGSLVDPTHVMTAAHCVEFIGGGPMGLPLEDFRVVVGQTVLGSDQGQVRRVEDLQDISIHPRWGPSNNAHDVAVIGLDRPPGGRADKARHGEAGHP